MERGTIEQLISTPVKPLEVTLGKLLPYFAIGVGDTRHLHPDRDVLVQGADARELAGIGAGVDAVFVTVLMLGFWISAATRSQLLASQFALLATLLPSFLLSGFGFPLGQTPPVVRAMSYLVPARYFVSLLKNIFLKGAGTASQ